MTHVNLVRRTAAPIWSPAMLLFLAAPLPAQRGGGTDSTPAPRSLAEVQTRVQAILVKEKAAGAGIALVTRDSVLWAGGLGLANPLITVGQYAEGYRRRPAVERPSQ